MNSGFFTLGSYRGIPVRLHWTAPLLAVLFGGFRWAPGVWLGVFLLIFLHELGHAFVVRRFGHKVTSVDVAGFGGQCRYEGLPTSVQRAAIAWGGVWAQLVVLALAGLWLAVLGRPANMIGAQVMSAFIETNLFLMAFNLIPLRPLDGAEAWALFPLLYRNWKGTRNIRKEINKLSKSPKASKRTPEKQEPVRRGDPVKNEEIFKKMMGDLLNLPDHLSATQGDGDRDRDRDPDKK